MADVLNLFRITPWFVFKSCRRRFYYFMQTIHECRRVIFCTSDSERSMVFIAPESHDTGYDVYFAADDVTRLAETVAVYTA